jgi:hypothetical protein
MLKCTDKEEVKKIGRRIVRITHKDREEILSMFDQYEPTSSMRKRDGTWRTVSREER